MNVQILLTVHRLDYVSHAGKLPCGLFKLEVVSKGDKDVIRSVRPLTLAHLVDEIARASIGVVSTDGTDARVLEVEAPGSTVMGM